MIDKRTKREVHRQFLFTWCKKCELDMSRIDEQNHIAQTKRENHRFGISMAITDFICHRYYDHKIIPTQSKYKDLRNDQEEWYDSQIKKGMCDNYEWIYNHNHEIGKILRR